MALPAYVIRSYGGGAVVAQLTQEMGSSDVTFAISPTTGWTEAGGAPLGTSGPFTVVVDRFTNSVEKILCDSINLVTGVVVVHTSGGSGRGYDGTTPQAHVPGGSSSGVQTCWTSVEAAEANKAVSAGSFPDGYVLTAVSGVPTWQPVSFPGTTGNPAGRIYQSTPQSIGTGGPTSATPLTGFTQDYIKGTITTSVSGTGEIIIGATGIYRVTAQVAFNLSGGITMPSGGLRLNVFIAKGGGEVRVGELGLPANSGMVTNDYTGVPMVSVTDEISCTAADVLTMNASHTYGSALNTFDSFNSGTGNTTFLSASLVSQ
jgi:hypothetical protein